MRILVNINQKASIIAGHEAPNSSEIIDVPVEAIPVSTREIIAPYYDLKAGSIVIPEPWIKDGVGGQHLQPVLTQPVTQARVLEELNRLATAHRVYLAAVAIHESEVATQEEKLRAAAKAADPKAAEYIDALPDAAEPTNVHDRALESVGLSRLTRDEYMPLTRAAFTRLITRHNAWLAAQRAEQDANKRKQDALKKEFLARWLSENATATVQRQFKDGLLSEPDALYLIRRATFDAMGLNKPYRAKVCADPLCKCYDQTVETLPVGAYEKWFPIKAKLPKDHTVSFSKVRVCKGGHEYQDDDDTPEIIYDAEITIPVGPFEVSRRVQL